MAILKWMTTASSGRSKTHGADDGVTGWRLHIVDSEQLVEAERYNVRYGKFKARMGKALCGVRPKMGFGHDLFIDEECQRCVKIAEKRGIDFNTID
jgi:hypothetical protein